MNQPQGVAVASNGDVYWVESGNNKIRKLSGDTVSTVTTNLMWWGSPRGLALSSTGDMFVADSSLHIISKISPNGTATTLVGQSWMAGWTPDGPAISARLSSPWALTLMQEDSVLVWTEQGSCIVRKLDLTSMMVSTLAGSPNMCGSQDGPALSARFGSGGLRGIATYGTDVFISDSSECLPAAYPLESLCPCPLPMPHPFDLMDPFSGNNVIRKLSLSTQTVSVFAGMTGPGYTPPSSSPSSSPSYPPSSMPLYSPSWSPSFSPSDAPSFSSPNLSPSSSPFYYPSSGLQSVNGPYLSAGFNYPAGIAFDSSGQLYVCEQVGANTLPCSLNGILSLLEPCTTEQPCHPSPVGWHGVYLGWRQRTWVSGWPFFNLSNDLPPGGCPEETSCSLPLSICLTHPHSIQCFM